MTNERLQLGKLPEDEYVGPHKSYEDDEIVNLLETDPDAYEEMYGEYAGVPDWAGHGFSIDDLEANQIKVYLNEVGIIKAGQEIGVWAEKIEIYLNNQDPEGYLNGLIENHTAPPPRIFFCDIELTIRANEAESRGGIKNR